MISMLSNLHKMMEALLLSGGNMHQVGGYVHGRTSNDDPYILLYPYSTRLEMKVCRVYSQDFHKLPSYVDTYNVRADTSDNPLRPLAIKRGIYVECPPFTVLTFERGETALGPEKRFFAVLDIPSIIHAKPTPNGSPIPQKNEGTVEYWREQAVNSDSDLTHDIAILRAVPFYKNVAGVVKFKQFFTDSADYDVKDKEHLVDILITYGQERGRLLGEGIDGNDAHLIAIGKVLK